MTRKKDYEKWKKEAFGILEKRDGQGCCFPCEANEHEGNLEIHHRYLSPTTTKRIHGRDLFKEVVAKPEDFEILCEKHHALRDKILRGLEEAIRYGSEGDRELYPHYKGESLEERELQLRACIDERRKLDKEVYEKLKEGDESLE